MIFGADNVVNAETMHTDDVVNVGTVSAGGEIYAEIRCCACAACKCKGHKHKCKKRLKLKGERLNLVRQEDYYKERLHDRLHDGFAMLTMDGGWNEE